MCKLTFLMWDYMKNQIEQSISGIIRLRLDQYEQRKANGEKLIKFLNELRNEGYVLKDVAVLSTLFYRARQAVKNNEITRKKTITTKPIVIKEKNSAEIKNENLLLKDWKDSPTPAEISAMLNDSTFDASKL